jgi:polysaccharide export outer membrane protein
MRWNYLLLLLLILPAFSTEAMPALATQPPLDYILGPEDVLEIYVDRHPELNREGAIGPDGKISFPLIGEVLASGLTRNQLENQIRIKMEKYLTSPLISVMIKEFNSFRIFIVGEVNKPGMYKPKGRVDVMTVLALSEGVTENADLINTTLIKKSGKRISLNLKSLLFEGLMENNLDLDPDDTLFIPREELGSKIFLIGEFQKPGPYTLRNNITVLEAITLGQGFTDKAFLQRTIVRRKHESKEIHIPVDLDALLNQGDITQNIIIKPSDTIFIPEGTINKIFVLGEVKNPGVYRLTGNLTVLEAVTLAGTWTKRAVLEKAIVIRKDHDKKKIFHIDINSIIYQGNSRHNLVLKPEDTVYLPETLRPDWKELLPMVDSIKITHDLIKNW